LGKGKTVGQDDDPTAAWVHNEKRGMDRRTLIKGAAVAGVAAWTAPVIIDSLSSPAAAITGPRGCFQACYNGICHTDEHSQCPAPNCGGNSKAAQACISVTGQCTGPGTETVQVLGGCDCMITGYILYLTSNTCADFVPVTPAKRIDITLDSGTHAAQTCVSLDCPQ
jgi:hypothetical protein